MLLAEDNDMNREIATELLELQGEEVIACEDGKKALEEFQRSGIREYDAILLDIRMPVMNGIQATEKIRTVDIDLPIVAVTANAFLIEQQQALAAGCNDIIAKPYTYERLKETIIKYI